MMHPVMFCFGRGSLHFTCNYLPLSAKQMTKDIYPISMICSDRKLRMQKNSPARHMNTIICNEGCSALNRRMKRRKSHL